MLRQLAPPCTGPAAQAPSVSLSVKVVRRCVARRKRAGRCDIHDITTEPSPQLDWRTLAPFGPCFEPAPHFPSQHQQASSRSGPSESPSPPQAEGDDPQDGRRLERTTTGDTALDLAIHAHQIEGLRSRPDTGAAHSPTPRAPRGPPSIGRVGGTSSYRGYGGGSRGSGGGAGSGSTGSGGCLGVLGLASPQLSSRLARIWSTPSRVVIRRRSGWRCMPRRAREYRTGSSNPLAESRPSIRSTGFR